MGRLVIGFIAVMIYRATLTQHETDQLFLGDDTGHVSMGHKEHDEIVARVDKLRPYYQGLGGVAVLMTVLVVGVYIFKCCPACTSDRRAARQNQPRDPGSGPCAVLTGLFRFGT